MGMYTDFRFMAQIDDEAIQIIKDAKSGQLATDKHAFWGTERYEHLIAYAYFEASRLKVVANFNCYDEEAAHFIDWIRPHVLTPSGADGYLGYSIYETAIRPTLYFMDGAR